MSRSVNYLMSGDAHAAYLLVGLRALRRHYDGIIHVYAYPESYNTVEQIARDTNLNIVPLGWKPEYQGKNGQFLNKIRLMQKLRTTHGIYLDADTMVCGSLNGLFEPAESGLFVGTQFNDWVTNVGVVRRRIEGLIGCRGINQESVNLLLQYPYASVNGGVFATAKNSPVLPAWETATLSVINKFIADEVCLHTFVPDKKLMYTAPNGIWNCSPKYRPKSLQDSDITIWHFHGDSNVRPTKSQKGYDLWWPEFQACLKDNVGSINYWIGQVTERNRFLRELVKL